MAQTSTPVALGLGGIAAILLISGIQDRGIDELLQGTFTHKTSTDVGGQGLGEQGKEPGIEGAPKGLISPFPKKSRVSWGRSDQGIDGTAEPGSNLLAMGDGTVEIAHDPSGFGSNYPVLHLDNDGSFYYGHSVPVVPSGSRVKKGQPIAHANINGQGNAVTPGSFEIGKWPPGSISTAGAAIRKWFTALPRI